MSTGAENGYSEPPPAEGGVVPPSHCHSSTPALQSEPEEDTVTLPSSSTGTSPLQGSSVTASASTSNVEDERNDVDEEDLEEGAPDEAAVQDPGAVTGIRSVINEGHEENQANFAMILGSLDQVIGQLDQAMGQREEKVKAANDLRARLDEAQRALRQERKEHKEYAATMEKEFESQRTEAEGLIAKVNALKQECDAKEEENKKLRGQLEQAERALILGPKDRSS